MFFFFLLFVLGDLLGRGGRVEVPVWERVKTDGCLRVITP